MTRVGSRDAAGVLRNLFATCREGEHRFLAAAEGVEDPTLKRLFQTYSEQRAGFARELGQELASVTGDGSGLQDDVRVPEAESSGSGSGLGVTDEFVFIAEREQGEEHAVAAYGSAVKRRLPGSAGKMVKRQYLQVKDAHEHVRSLERSLAGLV